MVVHGYAAADLRPGYRGRNATPHGRSPTFTEATTLRFGISMIDTSFDGPFAVKTTASIAVAAMPQANPGVDGSDHPVGRRVDDHDHSAAARGHVHVLAVG